MSKFKYDLLININKVDQISIHAMKYMTLIFSHRIALIAFESFYERGLK